MMLNLPQQIYHVLRRVERTPIPGATFGAAGLLVLADLSTIARKTAMAGTASISDMFVLCPGLHRQQRAAESNNGELPAAAAMTTGYVFRIENQATVAYLQRIGRTAHLVTVHVEDLHCKSRLGKTMSYTSILPSLLYSLVPLLTLLALATAYLIKDWWGMDVLLFLILARMMNIIVIRRRAATGWHGQSEPGVNGDLLVLLSQDRWIRIQGAVDAIKAVTSGQWLRDMTFFESAVEATSTIIVYIAIILTPNATQTSNLMLMALLTCSALILGTCNEIQKTTLQMHGYILRVAKASKQYSRRLVLAEELINETGRDDWAVRLGMINTASPKGAVIM